MRIIIGNLPVNSESARKRLAMELPKVLQQFDIDECVCIALHPNIRSDYKKKYKAIFKNTPVKDIEIQKSITPETKPFIELEDPTNCCIIGYVDRKYNSIDCDWALNNPKARFINLSDNSYDLKFDPLEHFGRIEYTGEIDFEYLTCEKAEIIFVAGPKSCGKTTFAKAFAKKFGYKYVKSAKGVEKVRNRKSIKNTIVLDINPMDIKDFETRYKHRRIILYGYVGNYTFSKMLYSHINFIRQIYEGRKSISKDIGVDISLPEGLVINRVYYTVNTIKDKEYLKLLYKYTNAYI